MDSESTDLDTPLSEAEEIVDALRHDRIDAVISGDRLAFIRLRETEEELRRSEARYRAVVEDQTELIVRWNGAGEIVFANPACSRYFGKAPEAFDGFPLLEVVEPSDRKSVEAVIERLSAENPVANIVCRVINPDLRTHWLDWSMRALFDNQGRLVEFQGVARDVTKAKATEAELLKARENLEQRVRERTAELARQTSKLRMLASQLTLAEQRERTRLAHVLHDHLQQLLVGAKFGVIALKNRMSEPDRQAAIGHVETLMDDCIKASRELTVELSPPILSEAGLASGLHWLVRWMQEKHGFLVQVDVDPAAAPKREDLKVLLYQCIRELLFNVVKHSGVSRAYLRMRLSPRDEIVLEVQDQGCGFEVSHVLPRGESAAAGFGLFSVHERLAMFGGRMEVESEPGRGSRFLLVVPRDPSRMAETPPEVRQPAVEAKSPAVLAPPVRPSSGKVRILLADDHEVMREGLSLLLKEEEGFEIIGEASDGEAAVRMAGDLQPDVILMDLSMPRLNGVEATRLIRREWPSIRVIGLSMFDERDGSMRMREAGAVGYVTKSGKPEVLIRAIRESVGLVPASPAPM